MRRLNIAAPFVLKEDIVLTPCAELVEHVRGKISFEEGDYALSHRHGRARSQILDGETAALLSLFREPRTIVSAVIENSRALGKDPRLRLDELLPPLSSFVDNRVLVPASSADRNAIRPRHDSGTSVAGWEIVRCARLVEDSEIYQVRRGNDIGALKIARAATARTRTLLNNEAAILRHLDGSGIAPRLLDSGVHKKRPYLILEWIAGVDAGVAAAQRHHDRPSLIELCAAVAAAYAALHARGVLHGDMHPGNVLAGSGGVTLIDFGFSRLIDEPPHVGRGGVAYFFEPEFLVARREGVELPTSAAGEQYGVAALLYFLIAGRHYLEFRLDREEMERQAESDPPLPLAMRGLPPWPEAERVLFRALEKNPERRYGSMAELAAALAEVRDAAARESAATPLSAEATALLETTLRSFARGGSHFATGYATPPKATVNLGCAGAAVGLLRIAQARSDPALLALAEVWRSRAAALIGTDGADRDPDSARASEISTHHGEPGIHAAAAMIAAARNDKRVQQRAIDAFLLASDRPSAQLDLTHGRSGSLLAAAMLLGDAPLDDEPLRAFGRTTMHAIWSALDAVPPLGDPQTTDLLGMAHGWAGYVYAALRWCAASGDPLPPRLQHRLDEYAALKVEKGRGVYWPTRGSETEYGLIPGWCHGSAGRVFLFTLADRVLGGGQWLELAELCAWNTWDEPRDSAHLCCGTAGRAYALLNFYKHTGRPDWLSRARQLANHAASAAAASIRSNTLWRGELGIATLIADLASPETARMPFFE